MSTGERIQRVRIYVSENDLWEQQPLYTIILDHLQREGASGATVLQGIAGFGPGHRMRALSLGKVSSGAPVVVEFIERASRINRLLPLLDELIPEALITIEDVQIHRATLRAQGPFTSDKNVGDIMQTNPQTITEAATLSKALALMLAGSQSVLPVIDEQRKIVGIVTEADIAQRAGLLVPLRLLRLLNKNEGSEVLGALGPRPITSVINREWRSVSVNAFIPQALVLMIEWNYDQIPVLARDDTLAGMLGWAEVLSAATDQASATDSGVQEVDQPTPVSLIMQFNVPQVNITQKLGIALQSLLAAPDHYLVVVDSEGVVQGSISDTGVFQRLNTSERAPLLAAIQRGTTINAADLPGATRGLDVVLERDVLTVSPRDSITSAIQRLVHERQDRALVVDEQGKLQGLITRGGLLRALVQES